MGRNPVTLCLGNFCIRLYSEAEKKSSEVHAILALNLCPQVL